MKYVKIIGLLFLITMALSVFGNLTISGFIAGEHYLPQINDGQYKFGLAAVALLLNSFGVLGIGLFTHSLLKELNEIVARVYLLTRIFEGLVLTIGIISLLSLVFVAEQAAIGTSTFDFTVMAKYAIRLNWYSYHVAMASLGLGSIPFCLVLLRHRLVPRLLSVLGLIGYSVLAVSSIVGLIGLDLGLLVTIPVFLFEVSLGFWLLIKGVRIVNELI